MTNDFLTAARRLGRQALVLYVDSERDFQTAFSTLLDRGVSALVIAGTVFLDTYYDRLAALALRYSMPAIFQRREFVEAGGLMSYSAKWDEAFRAAGVYVGRILKGANAAELPFQQSSQFSLDINLKTAKALDVDILPTLLALADEVIE